MCAHGSTPNRVSNYAVRIGKTMLLTRQVRVRW